VSIRISLLVLTALIALTYGCTKDKVVPTDVDSSSDSSTEITDSLQVTLILGEWDIESQTINGIGGGLVFGQTLDFSVDTNPNDFKGFITHSEFGVKKTGTFEVIGDSLVVTFSSGILEFNFSVQENALQLDYAIGSDNISEIWRKQ
jgi:hypothetical protein